MSLPVVVKSLSAFALDRRRPPNSVVFCKDRNPDQGSADAEADPGVSKSRVMESAQASPVDRGRRNHNFTAAGH